MSYAPALLQDFHITEYTPSFRTQLWNLFVSGMSQNDEAAKDDGMRRAISTLIDNARLEVARVGSLSCPKNGGKTFLALDRSKQVIGMLAVKRSEEDIRDRSVELRRISVAHQWRRRGVCRALVDHAVEYIKATFDSQWMHLVTYSSMGPALCTYKSLGFKAQGDDSSDGPLRLVKLVRKI
ncbi:hypothetical protein BWQ96_09335 [Gracilariopsis chorda]|uniref:N-acetyltransferase domain-containing protein n=1 Tax=Gracilariopsis chorda TaxID=448386 RepID=A0A2V3IIJ1_9FLOR|nr:hypothetical protein BWQ96_09335 [Gracilariopsis chorda]|eukprot:PXF40940.1 hypothetical protein BWQ96_09335 [Gracilariopsis chorda]